MRPRGLAAMALLALLAGVALRVVFACAHSAMEGDEYTYARMAQDLVGSPPGGQPLLEPVLWPVLWATAHEILPDWEGAGRTLAVLCSAGLLLALSPVSRRVFGHAEGGLAAMVGLAAYVPLVDLGTRPLSESLYHLLVLLSLGQGWRALRAAAGTSPSFLPECLAAGLLLGLAAAARREGQMALGLFPLSLALAGWRSRGPRLALAGAAACLGASLLVLLPARLVTEAGRPVPRATRSAATVAGLAGGLLLPLLAPAALLLLSRRRPEDGLRLLLFAPFLAVVPLVLLFPDPGRKAVALAPLAALAAGEGIRRLGLPPWGPAVLSLALAGWFFAQGLSAPLEPHLVPPWTDRTEDRAAGEWILARAGPGQTVASPEPVAAWYARGQWLAVRPATREALVHRCQTRGAGWLVVDRRSATRNDPVLGPLAARPGPVPGLEPVAVLPYEPSPLARLLSRPLRSRGVDPGSAAVVYRVSGPSRPPGAAWDP